MPAAVTNQIVGSDRMVNLPCFQTTDATPLQQVIYSVSPDSSVRLSLVLMARAADGRTKTWSVIRTGKNAAGVVSLVGTPPAATIEADANTSNWTASLSSTNGDVLLTIVGENGTPINWVLMTEYLMLSAP